MIDLRSDTVTRPTPEMMEAIAQAELGDDVWGDDPTVNRLQELAAAKLGMEASLFVPSGTMGNLIASLLHCARGEELILGDKSHLFRNEAGNVSVVGGIHPYVLKNQPDGTLALDEIEAAVRTENVHYPRSGAIALENTQNGCGGVAISPAYFAAVRQLAGRHGLAFHLDGARIFDAAVALDVPVTAFTQHVDTVMVCLSKSLCAPVGSILAGSRESIYKARKIRKMLGGGMRQAGILAAAGIVALEQMVDRLADDHANARRLAEGLQEIPGIHYPSVPLPPGAVTTNMVYFRLADELPITPQSFARKLEESYQIKVDANPSGQFRLVAHYWVKATDVEATLTAFSDILVPDPV
jgi:threonine aldolase